MRITKRQLRQIIREEAARLNESAGAMPLVGLTALGNGPMPSRPAASNRRRAISEAPEPHLAYVDKAMDSIARAMPLINPGRAEILRQILRDLEAYREDAYNALVAMGR